MTATAEGHLRYFVTSRTRPDVKHLVEIDAFHGSGICSCEFFTMKLEPLLRKGYTPDRAVLEKLVKLKAGQPLWSALRCGHIQEAREKFANDVLRAIRDSKLISHEANH